LPFLIAAALVAAALADPFVESLSNAGAFGGAYADNNHLCVLPALFAGSALTLVIAAMRCGDVWRSRTNGSGDWFRGTARDIARRSPWRDVPFVFAVQLLLLFLMESTEQMLAGGKLLGGIAWLGGPMFFSLLAHALIGICSLFVLRASMRTIERTFASLVRAALGLLWILSARRPGGTFRYFRSVAPGLRAQSPHARQIGGRAPPLLPTPA
jgi:hypothetical protein